MKALTKEQEQCQGSFVLRADGIWFCPKCGLEISIPPSQRWFKSVGPAILPILLLVFVSIVSREIATEPLNPVQHSQHEGTETLNSVRK